MKNLTDSLRSEIKALAVDKNFKHSAWFVKWHLNIVERIALELCDVYVEANRNLVVSLVWIHDFIKIKNLNSNVFEKEIKSLMLGIGFKEDFIKRVIEYLILFEMKMEIDLRTAPIEVQIVSSADGASHLVGPFMSIYLWENSDKDLDNLIQSNVNKAMKDWDRKIVLPEVRKFFDNRHKFVLENNGVLPDKFLVDK